MTYEKISWKLDIFYYKNENVKKIEKFNEKINFDTSEINETLQDYEMTQWQIQIKAGFEYAEEKMKLANRLMIAAISGSNKAGKYFKEFKEKFRPAGYYAEWYKEMQEILAYAKNK